MKNEFANRLGMARTVQLTLTKAAHIAIWQGQPPAAFGKKAALLPGVIDELSKLISDQETIITGFAELKDTEETELEDLAQETGAVLGSYFEDNHHTDLQAEVEFSISVWRKLIDESLVGRAKIVLARLTTALADDAPGLVDYDLSAADITALTTSIADYEKIINSPQAAISGRAALTKVARPRFRKLSTLLGGLDKLVIRFRKTPEGRAFVDAYQAARIVRDLGTGPSTPPPATP